jgi:glucokinase
MCEKFIGIEIGGTKLQLVVGRANQIIDRRRFEVVESAGSEGIRQQISSALKELLGQNQVGAIGVGFGGPVDWKTGRIRDSHQVHGWADFPLGEWLAAQTGLPVQLDNDANVAAWAESLHGAGLGSNPVFYVTLGSGVGGGLIADGKIYHGASGGEAEIGQIRMAAKGATVESLCAGWAVDRKIRDACARHPESLLTKLIGSEARGEARHLFAAWKENDALAQKIIDETGSNLAFALSHVVHLMHPEVIVLGGGLSLLGEPLRETVTRQLPPFLMKAFRPGPRIELASLKEDSVPVGALLLAEEIYVIRGQDLSKSVFAPKKS